MADTDNPVPETQEQSQQEEVVQDGANEEVTAETQNENGESQDTQEGQTNGGDDAEKENGGDDVAADGDSGEGQETTDGKDEQEERQPTPAVPAEEPAQEPVADCNGSVEEAQGTTDSEPAPEPTPEPATESQQEPVEEPAAPQTPAPAMTLTEEQMKRCQHYFDRRAAEGRLDLKGFKLLFRLMGEVLSAEDANKMFEDGNKDDNMTIDFDEFCRLYCCHSQEEHSRKAAMMESIDKLFPDTEGKPVELKKVKNLLLKMQRPDLDMRLVREKSDLNPGDIHRLVKSMDKTGTGLVSKQEFVDTLCKHLDHM